MCVTVTVCVCVCVGQSNVSAGEGLWEDDVNETDRPDKSASAHNPSSCSAQPWVTLGERHPAALR